jgi:translation initiation factor IF-2
MTAALRGEKRTLRIVIKADQGGPAEALADALGQLSHDEVSVEVIHPRRRLDHRERHSARARSGRDHRRLPRSPDNNARSAAEREGVDIKLYKVIYEAVEDVRSALEGMLRPEEREVVLGEAEVRELFKVPRMGVIAGCSVRSGLINRQGSRENHSRRRRSLRRRDRITAPLQGRCEGSARRIRVRYRNRELQRHQDRRLSSSAIARSRSRAL